MILVAPSIPKYWSLSLEEFGIRCIEVAKPPISMTQRTEITKQATGQRRKMAAEDDMLSRLGDVSSVAFQEMLPPVSRKSLALSHLFLRSSLESVNRRFSNYQVVPVKMVTSNSQDVLCFGFKHPTESPSFTKAGSWWAYALGRSEEMPKNDLPNISVSAMPWALDVAINAELRTSQLVIRRRITARPRDFDALLSSLPKMHFQAWLKLEHQPFFYHWIPTSLCLPGDWNAASVIDGITQSEKNFLSIRNEAISWIKKRRPELSWSQASHMERRNQALNLALRFVLPFEKRDPFWALTLDEQIELLNLTYVTLKPMMDFFHANEV
jgi:hypothetical protein